MRKNQDRDISVVLYSIRGDEMTMEPGIVTITPGFARGSYMGDKTGRRVFCATKEGVVYNGIVWFREVNEGKARERIAEYERKRICDLCTRLRAHEKKLSIALGTDCRGL